MRALDDSALPRVPLPTLERSCSLFLEWCAPLLTDAELDETRAAVDDFLTGPGPVLQAELAAYDGDESNDGWLDEFWRDRYLGRRDPIAINANFFFRFKPDPSQGTTQTERAASLLSRAADLRLRIDRGQIEALPESMRQMRHLFCTTRIPGPARDSVRTQYSADSPGPSDARHAVVFHRGAIYALDVLDESGTPYSIAALDVALQSILSSAAEQPDGVGVLTTRPRTRWADDRNALLAADPANADALTIVESAMCGLALEEQQPADLTELDSTLLGGSGRNRWFDLATTLIVFADGTAGLNGEHCLLDGMTILRLIDDLFESRDRIAGVPGDPEVRAIEFALNDDVRSRIARASEDFAHPSAQTALLHVPLEGLSRNVAKALGYSPDAFFQMMLQIAHARARGRVGATYESIATRAWRNGRTEAMRVVTPESVALVEVMGDPAATDEQRRGAFEAAAKAHVARARACQSGDAPEQHLWELDRIRERRGDQLGITEQPALFRSPGWRIMRDDWLSTSTAVTTNVQSWGFGATSPTCIGVGYALLTDSAYVGLSTPTPVAD